MSVTIANDSVTPTLQKVWESLAPGRRKPLMTVLGREAERVYRAWFRGRESDSPNKRGWPRQHFWARIRTATAFDPSRTTDDRAIVAVSDPALSAKVHGATIRPKEAKMLAIPLRAEAYGVRPRAASIPGLFLLKRKDGKAFLAAPDPDDKRFAVLFWRLTPRVTVPADPRALPSASSVGDALTARALKFFFRLLGGAKATS